VQLWKKRAEKEKKSKQAKTTAKDEHVLLLTVRKMNAFWSKFQGVWGHAKVASR
jgi:hypothetical protein